MNELCRLCLDDLKESDSVSVASSENGEKLSEIIFICTSLQVKQDGSEPQLVCKPCSDALIKYYKFRDKCLKTDQLLMKYLNIKTEKPEITSVAPEIILKTLQNNITIDKIIGEELCQDILSNTKTENINKDKNEPKKQILDVVVDAESQNSTLFIKRKKNQRKYLETVRESQIQLASNKIKKKIGKPDYFKCQYCNKIYPSEGGWRYHVHTMHSQSFQPFLCDLCGKAFKAKKNMEVHKRSVHFKVKENLCDLCGVKFATKYGLNVHKVWHSGEKKFECKVCEAKFASTGKLNTHLIIHEGFKKFMCEICSRVFRWKKDFVVHMRTHTGEKPFTCKICNKAFASVTNKRKHESSHVNAKTKNSLSPPKCT